MVPKEPALAALAARVTALRRSQGLTQDQLAERTGLGTPYISRIERAIVNPSLLVLKRLAKGLGLTLAELLATDAEGDTELAKIVVLLRSRSAAERRKVLAILRTMFDGV